MRVNELVNELMEKRNKIDAEIQCIENKITDQNTGILIQEVMNFLDGVTNNYAEEDGYTDSRYYSSIPGVKNIRLMRNDHDTLDVKLYSTKGNLLPKEITLRGRAFKIKTTWSRNYSDAVDY